MRWSGSGSGRTRSSGTAGPAQSPQWSRSPRRSPWCSRSRGRRTGPAGRRHRHRQRQPEPIVQHHSPIGAQIVGTDRNAQPAVRGDVHRPVRPAALPDRSDGRVLRSAGLGRHGRVRRVRTPGRSSGHKAITETDMSASPGTRTERRIAYSWKGDLYVMDVERLAPASAHPCGTGDGRLPTAVLARRLDARVLERLERRRRRRRTRRRDLHDPRHRRNPDPSHA